MVKRYSRKPSKRKYKVSKRTRKNSRKRSKGKNTRKKLRGGSRLVFYERLIDKLSRPFEELKKNLWRELKPKDQVNLKQLGYSEDNWPANVAIKKIEEFYPYPLPTAVARLYDLGFELKDIKEVLGDSTDDEKKIMEAQNTLFRKHGSRFTKAWEKSRELLDKNTLGTRSYHYKNKDKYNIDFPKGDFIKLLLQSGLNSAESPNLFLHFKDLGWKFSGGYRVFEFKSGKSEFRPDDHSLEIEGNIYIYKGYIEKGDDLFLILQNGDKYLLITEEELSKYDKWHAIKQNVGGLNMQKRD